MGKHRRPGRTVLGGWLLTLAVALAALVCLVGIVYSLGGKP